MSPAPNVRDIIWGNVHIPKSQVLVMGMVAVMDATNNDIYYWGTYDKDEMIMMIMIV